MLGGFLTPSHESEVSRAHATLPQDLVVTSDSPKDSGLTLSRAQRAQVSSVQQAPYSTGESWEEDPARRRQGVGGAHLSTTQSGTPSLTSWPPASHPVGRKPFGFCRDPAWYLEGSQGPWRPEEVTLLQKLFKQRRD